MRRVAIIQARMTSTRLPGKILMEVAGKPMLVQQLDRLRACRRLDDIVIATTARPTDDPVVDLARQQGIASFRGDEDDVLSRYLGAARAAEAELVVRVTADCPLLDPEVTDRVIARATDDADPCDYASNTLRRTFPRGLDTEALHRDVLERVARLARSQPAREHVTYFVHQERPDLFERREVTDPTDHSDLRWTVDTPDDLDLIRRIFALADGFVPYPALVTMVRSDPELVRLNAHISQKAV
jgi:spore coat polysaccharide biosynthesis protein SpsF